MNNLTGYEFSYIAETNVLGAKASTYDDNNIPAC
jgi:hypothetical protein